jgi:hypothetical protein
MAVIQEVICLPAEADNIQVHYGFEGFPADGHNVLVSCRTEGGLAHLPFRLLAMVDSLCCWSVTMAAGGPDAAIKRLYAIDLGDFAVTNSTVIEKVFVSNLMPETASRRPRT